MARIIPGRVIANLKWNGIPDLPIRRYTRLPNQGTIIIKPVHMIDKDLEISSLLPRSYIEIGNHITYNIIGM